MTDRVGQHLGNYHLLRVLGQGSFATVYLGEHQDLGWLVAIKVLHLRVEAGSYESFRREARTIAQLRHPHIIGVHDFGTSPDTAYLVMEYSPNGTLRSQCPKGTRLPFEQIVTYVKQIASALDYAHEQHVIHRDVKPENILLGPNHEVVLSDFGIAVVQRTWDSLPTQKPAGTPIYMAPEQIQHKPCAASDQYALGIMVYEWLCGEPPFHGPLFEVFAQHLHRSPPSLCTRLPELPPAVEDAVFGALAKDPGQRFESVTDFATVLEEAFFATQPLFEVVGPRDQTASLRQDSPSEGPTQNQLMNVPAVSDLELSPFSEHLHSVVIPDRSLPEPVRPSAVEKPLPPRPFCPSRATNGSMTFWVLHLIGVVCFLAILLQPGITQLSSSFIDNQGRGSAYDSQVGGDGADSWQHPPQVEAPSSGPYAVKGNPTITVDQVNQILSTYKSPAAGYGQTLYNLGVQYGIDPAFALSLFMHESTFGTKGEATKSLSLGNLRCIPNFRCEDNFAQFNTWEDGFKAWYQLIRNLYVAKWGLTTVDQILPRYAPQADNNNEQAYIAALKHAINTWRTGQIIVA
jgi:serine/threonine protein kinase